MTKQELITFINDEISVSGKIPNLKLPENEIERIVEKEKKKLFDIYNDSVQKKYTIVPKAYFYTTDFRKSRTLRFPDCIHMVTDVEEMRGMGRFMMCGFNDPDFAYQKMFQADLWMSPMGSDTVVYRTIQWNMWDLLRQFDCQHLQFAWQDKTHECLIQGHDPKSNVFIALTEKLKDDVLFEDPWVRQYLCACCKQQVVMMLGLFTYNLIGGVNFNADLYTQRAEKELEECKEYFKETNQPAWFVNC
jgi:hypothetical protein